MKLAGASSLRELATELVGHVTEKLGFTRCALFIDEAGLGRMTLAVGDTRDVVLGPSDIVQLLDAASSSAKLAALGFGSAIVRPVGDDEVLGIIIAEAALPDHGAKLLGDLIPDVLANLQSRLYRQRLKRQREDTERLVGELRRRNEEMLDDLEQAREFQAQLLKRVPKVNGLAIQAYYRAHDVVSGDLHDLSWDGERLRVFLADTTGHGLRAGLATMLVKAEYESVRRAAETPLMALELLNERILESYREGTLTMTAVCFDLAPSTGHLSFACAAHPAPVIVEGGTARELETGGSFLGLVGEPMLVQGTAMLGGGDGIYAYSDGITEASSATGELYGEARVLLAIAEAHAAMSPRKVAQAAERFALPSGFGDDVTILGIKREG
jgi:sigma-B regulation protein RsbU (phosphoserine phosphatase)